MDRLAPYPLTAILAAQAAVLEGAEAGEAAVMSAICEQAASLTGAEGASVELLEGNELVYAAAHGILQRFVGMRMQVQGSLSGLAIERREVLESRDTETDPRVNREATRRVGARSMIIVPLVSRGTVAGVVKVACGGPEAFQPGAAVLLQLLAGFLAEALSRAQLDAERRRAEELLQSSEKTFRSMVDSSPDCVLVHRSGKVVYANRGAVELLGWTEAEFEQRDVISLVHPDDAPGVVQRIARLQGRPSGRNPLAEQRLLAKSGEEVLCEVYGVPILFESTPSVMAVIRDIRPRKKLEAELRAADARERVLLLDQNRRLKETERFRTEMASMVVHDLKSPLSAVVANLGFVKRELPGGSDGELLEAIKDSLDATDRISKMILLLLQIEKLETGTFTLQHSRFQVDELVEPGVKEHRAVVEQKGLRLWSEPNGVHVRGDLEILRRVLDNILDNAVRYTRAGGEIGVWVTEHADRVRIHVGNSGKAIPLEVREKIFEKFEQVGAAARGSIGLGLYFCRLALQAHGGSIRVDSTARFPTEFCLELPTGA